MCRRPYDLKLLVLVFTKLYSIDKVSMYVDKPVPADRPRLRLH